MMTTNKHTIKKPADYRICIQGRLDETWFEFFEPLAIRHEICGASVFTYLEGEIEDQAALQGVLHNLCQLGFSLISMNRVKRSN
jgi:hypothetical protein